MGRGEIEFKFFEFPVISSNKLAKLGIPIGIAKAAAAPAWK